MWQRKRWRLAARGGVGFLRGERVLGLELEGCLEFSSQRRKVTAGRRDTLHSIEAHRTAPRVSVLLKAQDLGEPFAQRTSAARLSQLGD